MTEAKTTFQVTPKKQVLALLKDADQKKDKLQSISGELGAQIKEASDNGHLNRGAFGLLVKLYRMEEDKRADFLRSFDCYRSYADEEQLFGSEHMGDLADMAERSDAEEDAQEAAVEAQVDANTTALKNGIKPLTPQAELTSLFERGRIAYLEGKPGVTPEDLVGKTKLSDEYLRGWSSMAELSVEEREALKVKRQAEVEFDDTSEEAEPTAAGNRPGESGDAPGSYAVTH